MADLRSYDEISLWRINSLTYSRSRTHILRLGLHLAATYSLRSAPRKTLEWSPLLRLISYNSLQQAEEDGGDAGNMIKEHKKGTVPVALGER